MEVYSGFIAGTTGVFNERGQALEVESDLYCIRPVSSDERGALEVPAGDFNVLMFCEELISDMVDGYAIDSDKNASGTSAKRTDEINDSFCCGWSGRCVMCGRDLW